MKQEIQGQEKLHWKLNYNMQRAEEKAKDLGFETIDNIKYINIK